LEYANKRFDYLYTKMYQPLSGNKLEEMRMKIGLFLKQIIWHCTVASKIGRNNRSYRNSTKYVWKVVNLKQSLPDETVV